MSATVHRAIEALRDFLRGFLGLTATSGGAPSAGAARQALVERCARRQSCC